VNKDDEMTDACAGSVNAYRKIDLTTDDADNTDRAERVDGISHCLLAKPYSSICLTKLWRNLSSPFQPRIMRSGEAATEGLPTKHSKNARKNAIDFRVVSFV
jgi:hypothetical protein